MPDLMTFSKCKKPALPNAQRLNLLGQVVGWSAILVGLIGVILHLQSHFFYERTLRSLTYSAPFAAPLAYTGLGFLLIMKSHGRFGINRVGAMGSVVYAGRFRWEFCFQRGGSRTKRLLLSNKLGRRLPWRITRASPGEPADEVLDRCRVETQKLFIFDLSVLTP